MNGGARSLVIGSSGQVGGAILEHLGEANCIGTSRSEAEPVAYASVRFDLESAAKDPPSAAALFGDSPIDAVYLCAGMTWVDGCEADPQRAHTVNELGPAAVARAAHEAAVPLVYFSTEYVFDGADGPYDEAAAPRPRSVYGRSKLAGECAVLAAHPGALILRTTVVYGPEQQGKNFAYRMLAELREDREIRVPADQVSSPTYNRDLARAAVRLVGDLATGVYNVVGPEVLDRYTFALRVARLVGLPEHRIRPVATADLDQPAERPLRAGLLIDKLNARLGGAGMRGVEAAIADWLQHPRGRAWHTTAKTTGVKQSSSGKS